MVASLFEVLQSLIEFGILLLRLAEFFHEHTGLGAPVCPGLFPA